jgi:hypothetical protein
MVGRIARDSRPGLTADWDRGSKKRRRVASRSRSTAIPARQDLDYELADRGREAGCLFALDRDAHDTQAFIHIYRHGYRARDSLAFPLRG